MTTENSEKPPLPDRPDIFSTEPVDGEALAAGFEATLEWMKAQPAAPRGTIVVPTPAGDAVVQIKAEEDAAAGDVARVRFV